jgi:LAO/AO transport system kinase
LGDRIRMLGHTQDENVFIRSMASRGHLGGLATAALAAISILSATGFDVLIVETVGVGQSEIEIVELSDTTVLLMHPNAGDGVQAVKAGIIEIADVLVVNKADLPDADRIVRELRGAIRLSRAAGEGWVPPVVTSVALEPEGVQQVVAAIDGHRAWLDGDPLRKRRRQRTAEAIRRIAIDNFAKEVRVSETLAERVERGEIDLWSAAVAVTSGVGQDFRSSNTSDSLPR